MRSNVQPAHVPEPPELHLAGGTEGRAGLQRRRPAGAHVRFDVGSVEAAHDVPTERRVTPQVAVRTRVVERSARGVALNVSRTMATVASLVGKQEYGMVWYMYGMVCVPYPESFALANEC